MEGGLEKFTPKIEKITASAIRLGGQIFTGNTHMDAVIAMEEERPDWSDYDTKPEDGFMTSTGRFVQRDEAGEIAEKAEQLDHLGLKRKRDASEYLDAHDVDELKPKWLK
ncbi:MAG: hypothetical protein HYT93_03420 [Parcubacteria group bacterium]|nr:hypothetical protein [Parcubacteria group bacterium]